MTATSAGSAPAPSATSNARSYSSIASTFAERSCARLPASTEYLQAFMCSSARW